MQIIFIYPSYAVFHKGVAKTHCRCSTLVAQHGKQPYLREPYKNKLLNGGIELIKFMLICFVENIIKLWMKWQGLPVYKWSLLSILRFFVKNKTNKTKKKLIFTLKWNFFCNFRILWKSSFYHICVHVLLFLKMVYLQKRM